MNEYIQSAIQTIVHKAINDAPFDKTRTGIVKAVNTNNTYKVLIDGVEYPNVPIWHGLMANTNDVVKIKFPSGNVSQMYICEARTEPQSLIGEIKEYAGQAIPNGWLECNGAEVLKSDYPMLYNAIGDAWGTASDTNHFVLPNKIGRVGVGASSNNWVFVALEGSTFKIGTPTVARWGNGSSWYQKTLQAGTYTANAATFDNQDPASGTVKQVELRLDVGASGGEEKHTLAENEMPSHRHSRTTAPQVWAERATGNNIISPSSGTSKTVTKYSNYTGGSQPHNNMQPFAVFKYIICAQ